MIYYRIERVARLPDLARSLYAEMIYYRIERSPSSSLLTSSTTSG